MTFFMKSFVAGVVSLTALAACAPGEDGVSGNAALDFGKNTKEKDEKALDATEDLPSYAVIAYTFNSEKHRKLVKEDKVKCPAGFPHQVKKDAESSAAESEDGKESELVSYSFSITCSTHNVKLEDDEEGKEVENAENKKETPPKTVPGCYVFTGSSAIYNHSVGDAAHAHHRVGNDKARIVLEIHGEKDQEASRAGRFEVSILSGGATGLVGWIDATRGQLEHIDLSYCRK